MHCFYSRLLLILILHLFSATVAHAWWNEQWQFRKAIDISIPESLREQAGSQTVPIRLHSGNFPYFYSLAEGGADIRIIGADDVTPLAFHIESLDIIMGLGLVWVKLPDNIGNDETYRIWLYYGNAEATSSGDASASYDQTTNAVYHFAESAGLPRDSSAYGHHVVSSSAKLASEGYHADGLRFTDSSYATLPDSPALALDSERGFRLESWLKLDENLENSHVFNYVTEQFTWQLVINNLTPLVRIISNDSVSEFSATKNLVINNWHHVALNWQNQLELFIDGQSVLLEEIPLGNVSGKFLIGKHDDTIGFSGWIDELRLGNAKQTEWFQFGLQVQDVNSILVNYLEDEQQQSSGGSRFFASLWPLMSIIGIPGWAVIIVLGLLGIAAVDVMLTKAYLLNKLTVANNRFIDDFQHRLNKNIQSASKEGETTHQHSAYWRILNAADKEMRAMPSFTGTMPPSYGDAIRASMDEALLEETNRLNSSMVWITLAVSGGPFLGLLGTVIGVMITFATIAQSGDVNVNTIAPGVAAALGTTVLGLVVAIPALFGYNYLSGRISRLLTDLEMFSDRLLVTLSITQPNKN